MMHRRPRHSLGDTRQYLYLESTEMVLSGIMVALSAVKKSDEGRVSRGGDVPGCSHASPAEHVQVLYDAARQAQR